MLEFDPSKSMEENAKEAEKAPKYTNKYYQAFLEDRVVKIEDVDFTSLPFEERYWLLGALVNNYYLTNNRFLAYLCLARFKELAFVCFAINRVHQCGFLDEKYKDYVVPLNFPLSDQKFLTIDQHLSQNTQKKNKIYNILTTFSMLVGLALIFMLHSLAKLDIIIAILIGVGSSLVFSYVILPLIARYRARHAKKEVLSGEVPERIKELIAYDARANDVLKEEDYKPIITARNEAQLNTAIRNFPKK